LLFETVNPIPNAAPSYNGAPTDRLPVVRLDRDGRRSLDLLRWGLAPAVEHKNPKDGDAIERAIKQLRRYEIETPELIAAPQLFNVTRLLDYWFGVTWGATRRDMARWKQTQDEGTVLRCSRSSS
jgi:SOS response associated peptidase (SRAP)